MMNIHRPTIKIPKQALTQLSVGLVIGLSALVIATRGVSLTHAASVTDTYSPSSKTVATGSTFTMAITTNAGSSHVLTDQLRVTFNASKLQFVSISYSGSGLDTDAPDAGAGSGYYQISRYSLSTHPTGSFTLATITFKALAASGSDTVGYDAANSSVYLQEDGGAANALTSVAGATYSFDGTAPTVSVTAPANNATASGTINMTATASDGVGVTRVDFLVDGAVKSSDASSPYSYSFGSSAYSDGSHALAAKAYDAVGNVGTATVTVTFKNGTSVSSGGGSGSTGSGTTTTTSSGTSSGATKPTTSTSNTNTTAAPSTTNTDGVKVAENSQYAVKAAPDKKTPAKTNKTMLYVGLGIAGVGIIAASAVALRMVARHRDLMRHIAVVPQGAEYGPHQQPIAPANIPDGANVIHPTDPPQPPSA